MVRRFIDDESGATAIEYGLITALVSVACIVTLQTLGDAIIETIETVAAGLSS
ncbi:MAG: Flp family type IVb pilin [Pseudomonadota bacterium]